MPARRTAHKGVDPKVKAVALVGTFLSALGAALAAANTISWAVVIGAVVTAVTVTVAGYQKASR